MEQYISKSVLVAEIKKLKMDIGNIFNEYDEGFWEGRATAFDDVICAISNLEVKEVDLEKEIEEEYLKRRCYGGRDNMLVIFNEPQFNKIAKHFFKLGLLSTITEEDCKLIWNIGDDLSYMPEEDFFKELLRRYKAQKGE